jgi:hypothetical protein
MIEIVFALSFAVSVVLFVAKRRFQNEDDLPKRLLVAGLLEFTVPLTIASALFTLLSRWLALTSSTHPETTIAEIEQRLRWIRTKWIDPLDLPEAGQLALVLLLALAGVLWPQLRKYEVLDAFNKTTRWISRAYMLATLCVSFTFLGSVYTGRARAAELRLSSDIKTIERNYQEYLNALEEVVETELAAELVRNPALEPAVVDLRDAAANFTAARRETHAALDRVFRYPGIAYRDFPLPRALDLKESRETYEKAPAGGKRPASEVATRDRWNRSEGQARHAEAEQLRRESKARRTESSQVIEKGFDVAQDGLGEAVAAAMFRDSTVGELLKLVLDPAVLYLFRDLAAKEVDAAFRESLAGRTPLRVIVARRTAALRAQLAAIATRASSSVRQSAASCAATWRQEAARAREVRGSIDAFLKKRAEAQYAREAEAFAHDWRTHNRFPTDTLMVETGWLLERILRRASQRPPLKGVAELRALRPKAIREGATAGAAAADLALVEVGLFRTAETPLHDYLERSVNQIVEENLRTRWGWLRAQAGRSQFPVSARTQDEAELIADGMAAWRSEERRRATELVAAGRRWDTQAWESSFADFCASNERTAAAWGLAMRTFYDRSEAEAGYGRYLQEIGRDGAREAERVFSREGVNKLVRSAGGDTASHANGHSGSPGKDGRIRERSRPKHKPKPKIVHR